MLTVYCAPCYTPGMAKRIKRRPDNDALVVRLDPPRRRRYEQAAKLAGYVKLSPWIRHELDRAAAQVEIAA